MGSVMRPNWLTGWRVSSMELGDGDIAMQVDEIRNAGTDGVGWTERVACWQTVNWPEQKIVRGECGEGTACAWDYNIKMDCNI